VQLLRKRRGQIVPERLIVEVRQHPRDSQRKCCCILELPNTLCKTCLTARIHSDCRVRPLCRESVRAWCGLVAGALLGSFDVVDAGTKLSTLCALPETSGVAWGADDVEYRGLNGLVAVQVVGLTQDDRAAIAAHGTFLERSALSSISDGCYHGERRCVGRGHTTGSGNATATCTAAKAAARMENFMLICLVVL
jgi:hypothetical protein